jgi:hypothetical protein
MSNPPVFQRSPIKPSATRSSAPDLLSRETGVHIEALCLFLDELVVVGSVSDNDALISASTRMKGIAHRLKAGQTGIRIPQVDRSLALLRRSEQTGLAVKLAAQPTGF